MDYKPALPGHNDNVSHDRPFREFVLLFSGICLFLVSAFWILGLFVDLAVDHISPEMEAVIFRSSSALSAVEKEKEDDPAQAELQRLTDQLRQCIHLNYPLKLVLMDAPEANAMALPGGRIVVLKGLLNTVSSENGLSFVLAHELAHFKHRDHLRGLGRGMVLTAVSALLTGAGSDVTQLLAPSVNFSMARYSQTREALADREALEVLNCFYGHVGGADEFFKAVQPREDQGIRKYTGHYFDSHPQAQARIASLERQAREMHFSTRQVDPLPPALSQETP